MQDKARRCASMIREAETIVLLSGAGMSTSAGIPDFRGPEGLYRKADISNPESIFDIQYFDRDPSLFYSFHKEFLKGLEAVSPTFGHRFFAALEKKGKIEGVITQNIDSLHQKAGSEKVYEIHGGIWDSYCRECGKKFGLEWVELEMKRTTVPRCDRCGGVVKPDVVFFGEMVKHLGKCQQLATSADLLFVVGSSLAVTPAAMLPSMSQGKIAVINKGDLSRAYLSQDRIDLLVEEDIDDFFREVADCLDLSLEV